jgi:hypothetical protein
MNRLLQDTSKNDRINLRTSLAGLSLICALALTPTVHAATLCVDQHGKPGCHSTIASAVAAAAPGDTINVDAGTYREDVVIGESLSLVGENPLTTIIDASALSNGVYVDGFDNAGLSEVLVTGFTVTSANFEGILVTDASAVTVWGNIVRGNDLSLQGGSGVCPGQPAFETAEGGDCGEGIHLIGVVHSSVADNFVWKNAGGILLSDEITTTHDNVVTRNLVFNNGYAGGITLASHPAYQGGGSTATAYGLYNNTVSENDSVHNGFGTGSGGAGIGIFSPGAGNRAYANQIVDNRLIGNAMSGVAVHTLAIISTKGNSGNPDASRNAIVGNFISGNGADAAVPTTVPTGISVMGVSPIVDLLISNNVIQDESIDVAFNSASTLDIHLNDFAGQVGVDNLNPLGIINARENWWGCAGGPGARGCSTVAGPGSAAVAFTPWLTRPMDGTLGHGLDGFFNLLHDYDFNHDPDCDLSQLLGMGFGLGFGFGR